MKARIVVEQLADDDPDLSFLGTYTDRAEPFAIDREERGHRGSPLRSTWCPRAVSPRHPIASKRAASLHSTEKLS